MKKIGLFILALLTLLPEGFAQVETIGLVLRDTSVLEGGTIDLPVSVNESLTDKGVFSYSFHLQYDPRYLKLDSVITEGTLSGVFGPATFHETQPDYYLRLLTIAASGIQPLEGEGVLLRLRFKALKAGWQPVRFTGSKNTYFNEGVPFLSNPDAGCYIRVESPSVLQLYPGQATLVKGDSLHMEAWYGTPPYHWLVSDTTVARISDSGLLVAVGTGSMHVTAIDTNGVSGATDRMEVLPYRIRIPDNLLQVEGQVVDVPLFVTDLSGLGVMSGSFRLQYDDYYLNYEGIESIGGLLESYNVIVNASESERLSVAFAGNVPLEGGGMLMMVRFRLLRTCYGTTIQIDQSLFNETIKGAHANGAVQSRQAPDVSVYPTEGRLVVGESDSFIFYGAVGPQHWTVSDTTVARINDQGVMTALKRGTVRVIGVDSTGVSVSTGPFMVYDTRVVMPDTGICNFDRVVHYPVSVEYIPTEGLYSFEATLRYDTTRLSFDGISLDATVASNWAYAYNLTFAGSYGYLHIASSGTQPLSSPGVLYHAAFKPRESFDSYTHSWLKLERFVFNEGMPSVVLHDEGSIFGQLPKTNRVVIRSTDEFGRQYVAGDTIRMQADVYDVLSPVYQWFVNGVMVDGATLSTFATTTLVSADTVTCRVTALDECIIDPVAWSNPLSFYIETSTLVSDVSSDNLTAYPNPFKESLSVRSTLLQHEQASLTVYDLAGQKRTMGVTSKGNERILDFSLQPAGFYLIVIQTPTQTERVKVLKQ